MTNYEKVALAGRFFGRLMVEKLAVNGRTINQSIVVG